MMSFNIKTRAVIVSACLLGIECNYKGGMALLFNKGFDRIVALAVRNGIIFVPVCPEQLGGLSTPRIPAELQDSSADILNGKGTILNKEGADVTNNFVKGARETLKIARISGADFAVLKSNSPSCGSEKVYDGTFSGCLIPGNGVTAAILAAQGLKIFDERSFEAFVLDSFGV